MRQAVTFAVSGNKHELIFGPNVSVGEQQKWIKRVQHDGYSCDYILHWTSDGDRRRFHPPRLIAKQLPKKLVKV